MRDRAKPSRVRLSAEEQLSHPRTHACNRPHACLILHGRLARPPWPHTNAASRYRPTAPSPTVHRAGPPLFHRLASAAALPSLQGCQPPPHPCHRAHHAIACFHTQTRWGRRIRLLGRWIRPRRHRIWPPTPPSSSSSEALVAVQLIWERSRRCLHCRHSIPRRRSLPDLAKEGLDLGSGTSTPSVTRPPLGAVAPL